MRKPRRRRPQPVHTRFGRWSGFLRPAPTAGLRHRHSECPPRDRATTRGMLPIPARRARGGRGRAGAAGSEGTARPGLPRAARAPGAPSLPHTQPLRLPGPSCCCATHIWAEMARVGCGDHPAVWPEVPHLRLRLEKDSGRALGRPGRAAGPVPIPGGHEGAASPQEPGWGEDGEEGAAGAGGEAQRRPRAGVPSRRALRGPGPHTRIRPLGVRGEPRESGGHWGHSPGSARCRSREATNVLFDHLPS